MSNQTETRSSPGDQYSVDPRLAGTHPLSFASLIGKSIPPQSHPLALDAALHVLKDGSNAKGVVIHDFGGSFKFEVDVGPAGKEMPATYQATYTRKQTAWREMDSLRVELVAPDIPPTLMAEISSNTPDSGARTRLDLGIYRFSTGGGMRERLKLAYANSRSASPEGSRAAPRQQTVSSPGPAVSHPELANMPPHLADLPPQVEEELRALGLYDNKPESEKIADLLDDTFMQPKLSDAAMAYLQPLGGHAKFMTYMATRVNQEANWERLAYLNGNLWTDSMEQLHAIGFRPEDLTTLNRLKEALGLQNWQQLPALQGLSKEDQHRVLNTMDELMKSVAQET